MRTTVRWVMLFSCMAAFFTGSSLAESACNVSLPQNVESSCCREVREQDLLKNQMAYRLITGKNGIPFALVDLTPEQLQEIIALEPFTQEYARSYQNMTVVVKEVLQSYVRQEFESLDVMGQLASDDGEIADEGKGRQMKECDLQCQVIKAMIKDLLGEKLIDSIEDLLALLGKVEGLVGFLSHEGYEELRNYFRTTIQSLGNDQLKFPTTPQGSEPLQEVNEAMVTDDDYFAQQRLAGVNPMSLQRVKLEGGSSGGVDWFDLSKTLNPTIRDDILNEVGINGTLFVLRYPFCDDLPKQFDLTHFSTTHKMEETRSPIALFVRDENMKGGLRPIFIQMDYTPDSDVYTPADGNNWALAKLNVETTNLFYNQFAEHLSKVHFVSEAFCVAMKRHLPDLHPLQQIMKFHCREVMVPNVFGAPLLLNPVTGFARLLFAAGLEGAELLINRVYPYVTWDVTDFFGNIKARGLENEPEYFPYRDDGKLIFDEIEGMVQKYVYLYYPRDSDVTGDKELQAFASEVSAEGTGQPDSGDGQIRGFPTKITTRKELIEILTRIIFHVTAQHASVSYELSDYASYVPIMPAKTYSVDPSNNLTSLILPNKATASIQVSLAMSLSTLRYDRLFDYGDELMDQEGATVVKSAFNKLQNVTKIITSRNDQRFQNGMLTYPYLLPDWLPNGIQT